MLFHASSSGPAIRTIMQHLLQLSNKFATGMKIKVTGELKTETALLLKKKLLDKVKMPGVLRDYKDFFQFLYYSASVIENIH